MYTCIDICIQIKVIAMIIYLSSSDYVGVGNVCVRGNCERELGCKCAPDCETGLMCVAQVCVRATVVVESTPMTSTTDSGDYKPSTVTSAASLSVSLMIASVYTITLFV